MILVTVGAQMPFDRLIAAVDAWAALHPTVRFFAQIGEQAWTPRHIPYATRLAPNAFIDRVRKSTGIVAHAGMGSILSALEHGKPILVMPRRGDLGETRNDHQFATARRFASTGRVQVAFDETALPEALDRLVGIARGQAQPLHAIGPYASTELLDALRAFVWSASSSLVVSPGRSTRLTSPQPPPP